MAIIGESSPSATRGIGDRAIWIIAAAATIISVAMGIRQAFGLFIGPFSADHGIPITTFALALAIQNLIWGLAQPVAGAIADRKGAGRVVVAGGCFLSAGLAVTAFGGTGSATIVGIGVLFGLGLSCTTFAVVLGVVGRAVSFEKRAMALSLASAGGSLGQVGIVPFAQQMIGGVGADSALYAMSVLAIVAIPVVLGLGNGQSPDTAGKTEAPSQSIAQVITEAAGHSGFLFLTAGFFVCGFQLAFIAIHLPGYLSTCALPASLSAMALALIGFFNIVGTWACGALAGRFSYKMILAVLYTVRGSAIVIFLMGPKNDITVITFAIVMGLAWLGTVPMTSGLIAQIFGTKNLGTLFGICFVNHQVGSFFGAWFGGWVFATTGSYDLIWIFTAGAGFIAAILHMPINDRSLRPA